MKLNTAQWEKQFDGQVKIQTDADAKTLEMSVQVLENVIRSNTPIGRPELWKYPAPAGYLPGTLKASWATEKETIYHYTVYNPQPYALRVEEGWSTQAPQGMMRRATLSWDYIVTQVRNGINK